MQVAGAPSRSGSSMRQHAISAGGAARSLRGPGVAVLALLLALAAAAAQTDPDTEVEVTGATAPTAPSAAAETGATATTAADSGRSYQPSGPATASGYDLPKKKSSSYLPPSGSEFHPVVTGGGAVSGGYAFNHKPDKVKMSYFSAPNKEAVLGLKYGADKRREGEMLVDPADFRRHAPYPVHSRYGPLSGDGGDYGVSGWGDDDQEESHHYPELYHGPGPAGGHHFSGPPVHIAPQPIYVPSHHHHHNNKDGFSKLTLLALAKLALAKFKALGVLKVLLVLAIKIPLILFKIALKFFFFVKAVKLIKLLTLPLLIPAILIPLLLLAPLLLLPLLLLPLLLPLLLLLPVPVVGPTQATEKARHRRSAALDDEEMAWPAAAATEAWRALEDSQDFLTLTRRVLESQQCLERLACKMAARQRPGVYNNFIVWALSKFQLVAPASVQPRLTSYTDAYSAGSASSFKKCGSQFKCDKPKALGRSHPFYDVL